LELAEAIAGIRIELGEAVALLERESGERWTPGLRVSQFARELRGAEAHLKVADIISGRLDFVIDHLAGERPNDDDNEAGSAAALC
jgi:hypothetical protein